MKNIDELILKIASFSNKRAVEKGFSKNPEYSYGVFLKEVKNILNGLDLSPSQFEYLQKTFKNYQ